MKLRVVLRSPRGDVVERDLVAGRWQEPSGSADDSIGQDLWALPGLADGHAHLAQEDVEFAPGDPEGAITRAREAVTAGVLIALDKGWGDLTTIEMLDKVPLEERPHVEAAGVILTVRGGYIAGFGREVQPGEVDTHVGRAAEEGRGWVKMIGDWPRRGSGPLANFTEDELISAVRIAAARGARVAVHTMAREVPSVAVRAGVDSIDHGLFLEPSDLGLLGARDGIWVPTVLRMEAVIRQLGAGSSGGRLISEGLDNVARLLPLAREAGVNVLAGTDLAVGTHEVAREALRLGEMGLGPSAVIDAVSYAGYRASGRDSEYPVDQAADAVLFSANPLDELGVLAHPALVIRQGRVVT